MRRTTDPQALSWLADQLRWERVLDELRRAADQPEAPVVAAQRPQAA
jgi:hypothetical protein